MNTLGTIMWAALDIRGLKSHFSKDDPMHILLHNPDIWLQIATEMGFTVENLASMAAANVEVPYLEFEQAVNTFLVMSKIFWNHPEFKGKQVYEIVHQNRTHEDFTYRLSYPKIDFRRKYNHTQCEDVQMLSMQNKYIAWQAEQKPEINFDIEDMDTTFWLKCFMKRLKRQRDVDICKLLHLGFNRMEIATILGYASHSGVSKRIKHIKELMIAFLAEDNQKVYAPEKSKQAENTVKYDIISFSYKRTTA